MGKEFEVEIVSENNGVIRVKKVGKAKARAVSSRRKNNTRLSEKSTTKMSQNIKELNNKVLQFISG
ncbi:hypothetical protein [Bacillus coreaensis]